MNDYKYNVYVTSKAVKIDRKPNHPQGIFSTVKKFTEGKASTRQIATQNFLAEDMGGANPNEIVWFKGGKKNG